MLRLATHRKAIAALLDLARPQTSKIAVALACLAVSSGVNLVVPAAVGKSLDSLTALVADPETMVMLAAAGLTVFSAGAAANYARIRLLVAAGQSVIADLRSSLFGSLVRKNAAFFDTARSGELVTRLSADTALMGSILVDNVPSAVRNVLQGIGGVAMMFYLSPVLALTTLGFVPPIAAGAVFFGRHVRDLQRGVQDELAATSALAEERLSNVRTVKLFAQEETESVSYASAVARIYDLAVAQGKASALFYSGIGLAGNVTVLGVLGVGASQVAAAAMTLGDLTSFLMYTIYVGVSVGGVFRVYGEVMKGVGASARVFALLDAAPPAADHHPIPAPSAPAVIASPRAPAPLPADLHFDRVGFAYPSRPETRIFDELSFRLEPGTRTALVGPSGSGKSSIVALATGLYPPTSGRVVVNDKDVALWDLRTLRSQVVGVVPQEAVLFSGSIRDNVAYAAPGASQADIERACDQAHAHDFITAFPDGYDTLVGERGVTLSGGQRQRIAIARTVLTNPSLLILDEATSALDPGSEGVVQRALEALMEGRTTLMITHRLASIAPDMHCVVLDSGRIVEAGTFAQLRAAPASQLNTVVAAGART
ncbi:ATP-binding cassette sub-family B member 10 [Thecamonas trahens ATCC 50062]|uniref:ATP-binding cassette sub-family B member 10 n=1 Tax=Thecamonas trahens ATCC 50062 TaxID=461836 RepID=A0A0L0DUG8_THETB|nr:ATP-binding cassette sub-family B member 10 [Thecamonas trahens ATCC 50062]KNC55098.1 ATP-binding cassette sub-family B member 10 [Thecamonas trahens ATCC 50062]|eukprot:XP_013753282.1 ATP-binding cassette sub-family B member 10 [Thecamonas trahens ATCC 50062]